MTEQKNSNSKMNKNGTVLLPEDGNLYRRQNDMHVKVTAEHTGGAYEVCEEKCPPGFASRKHMHTKNHETFYLTEGSAEFSLGEESHQVTPGMCIHILPKYPTK